MNPVIGAESSRFGSYQQLDVRFDPANGALWCHMHPTGRPCFTPELIADLELLQETIIRDSKRRNGPPVQFQVLASSVPGIFSLGGDLALFRQLIRDGNRDGLRRYGRDCVDVVYHNAVSYGLPIRTVSLVQGDAIGGGFEAALSSNYIIAERSVQMGFPEVLFNLFPGMGAMTLLTRRISPVQAERMILSGRLYSASELLDLGVIDMVVDDGQGPEAVETHIRRQQRMSRAYQAVHQVRQRVNPVSYDELVDVVNIWADAALRLDQRDLKIMERLVVAQEKHSQAAHAAFGQNAG